MDERTEPKPLGKLFREPYWEVYIKLHWWARRQFVGAFHTPGAAFEYQGVLIVDLREQGTKYAESKVFVAAKHRYILITPEK